MAPLGAGVQGTRSAHDSNDQDSGTPNSEGGAEAPEVRLPAVDGRRPPNQGARSVKTVNAQSESTSHSSFASRASSPLSSLRGSRTLLSSSGQSTVRDSLPFSYLDTHYTSSVSPRLNQQRISDEESESPVYKNNFFPGQASIHQCASLTGTLPRSSKFHGERAPRNKITVAAKLELKQEEATKQPAGQRDKEEYQRSGAGPPMNPSTPRQSKHITKITTPLTDEKPAVKLPQQHQMSSPNMKPVERPNQGHSQSALDYRRDSTLLQSLHRPSNASCFASSQAEWKTWQELTVKISDLPVSATTRDLWRCFSGEGTITMIEFYENQRGQREGRASIRFRYASGSSYRIGSR